VGKAAGAVYEKAHEHGLIVRAIGDSVAFCPPLIITPEQVRDAVSRFGRALDDVTRQLQA
jgi:4-aminobutyrate--pyruvate transaminase